MRTYYGCCLSENQENVDDCLCYENELESVLALIYRHYDYLFSIGKNTENSRYYVCERIEDAIKKELSDLTITLFRVECNRIMPSGLNWMDGIYLRDNFKKRNQVKKISLHDYLITSSRTQSLIIFRYPERPLGIPRDDHDLVERAIIQFNMYGPSVLIKISSYHPDLYDRVMQGIKSGLYKEYGI